MNRRVWRWVACAAALGLAPGVRAQVPPDGAPQVRGVVYLVGGIGGFDTMGSHARTALPAAGVPHEIRHFPWSHGKGKYLKDLQDTLHLARKADELAVEIKRQRDAEPERPIYVVAKSGGTGLALLATRQLAPGTLHRLVLVSAAVAPDYDLRPALRATRNEVVSFASKNDQIILNWGTRQFGTIDRFYGPGAGYRGFVRPAGLDAEGDALYGRLVQIHWHPGMLKHGYAGLHSGTSNPTFLTGEIAPWLLR